MIERVEARMRNAHDARAPSSLSTRYGELDFFRIRVRIRGGINVLTSSK